MAENATAAAEAADTTTGGAAGTAATEQQSTQQQLDPTKIASQQFSKGINDERTRMADDLKRFGVEPVLDEYGRIDRSASLQALMDHAATQAAASAAERKAARGGASGKNGAVRDGAQGGADGDAADGDTDDVSGKEKVYREQVAAAQKSAEESKAKAEAAEKRAREIMEQSYVNAAFTGLPILEGHGQDLIDLFKLRHRIEMVASGEVRVYQGKELVYIDDDKDGIRPATINEAARMFLDKHPAFMTPSARPRSAETEAVGNATVVTSKDLASGKVKPEDIISGKVIVRD